MARVLGGSDDLGNLALSGGPCNLAKGAQTHGSDPVTVARVVLFHPRVDSWDDHFMCGDNGYLIVGRTPGRRATVVALNLNASMRTEARRYGRELGSFP